MKYDFYQKINYFGTSTLRKIGEYEVPDNTPTFSFPVRIRIITTIKDTSFTSDAPQREYVHYNKVRTIVGDIYVADIDSKIKKLDK